MKSQPAGVLAYTPFGRNLHINSVYLNLSELGCQLSDYMHCNGTAHHFSVQLILTHIHTGLYIGDQSSVTTTNPVSGEVNYRPIRAISIHFSVQLIDFCFQLQDIS
jgi:hypothetical protein